MLKGSVFHGHLKQMCCALSCYTSCTYPSYAPGEVISRSFPEGKYEGDGGRDAESLAGWEGGF